MEILPKPGQGDSNRELDACRLMLEKTARFRPVAQRISKCNSPNREVRFASGSARLNDWEGSFGEAKESAE